MEHYDSVIAMITPNLIRPTTNGESTTSSEEQTLDDTYREWRGAEGLTRSANIDAVYDAFSDVRDSKGELMHVSSIGRKELGNDDMYNLQICEEVAEKTAKGMMVLDLFGEQGRIELQNSLARCVLQTLFEYKNRTPF